MPHLRIRGMKPAQVQKLSEELNVQLARILGTTPDNFTVELVQTQFFNNGGKPDPGYPFVEVLWFERSSEEKKQCAQFITNRIRQLFPYGDIAVVFQTIDKSSYFENGNSF